MKKKIRLAIMGYLISNPSFINSQEYDSIQQLFEKVKLFVNENMNPFNSIYEFLNPDVFESWDFVQYETSISNLYKQYYEEI